MPRIANRRRFAAVVLSGTLAAAGASLDQHTYLRYVIGLTRISVFAQTRVPVA